MIKVIRKNGDVHYLNESAFVQIKYCKDADLIIASPINSDPEITLEGIQSIIDNIKTEETQPSLKEGRDSLTKEEMYQDRTIEEVLNFIKNRHSDHLYATIRKFTIKNKIYTVGSLVQLNRYGVISTYRSNAGEKFLNAVSEAMKELYGILW
jgi:uncharacterized protein YlzI (FlbEa/FlbD family)